MATLTPGKPITVATPELLVENKLAEGKFRFQLVAIDDAGNESDPAELVVTVRTPPIRPPIDTTLIDRSVLLNPVLRPVRRPG